MYENMKFGLPLVQLQKCTSAIVVLILTSFVAMRIKGRWAKLVQIVVCMCMCARVCLCMCVCVRACVPACVPACVRA